MRTALDTKVLESLAMAKCDRPSEVLQADERWQQLLKICPKGFHRILRLRREGRSLDEIAAATGFHKSSVRRILYQLAQKLAANHDSLDSSRNV